MNASQGVGGEGEGLLVEEGLVPLLEHLRIQPNAFQKGLNKGGVALVTSLRWKKYEKAQHTVQWTMNRRLDNIIWRAWQLHYMCGRQTKYIEFAEVDSEIEAQSMSYPILEGHTDQETIMNVTSGYQSWRKFWKNRISQVQAQREKAQEALASGVAMEGIGLRLDSSFSDQMFLDAWNMTDLELGNISELMDTIPDTLFTTLPSATTNKGMMDLDLNQAITGEYIQTRYGSTLLRGVASTSYHDFISSQLTEQPLYPGLISRGTSSVNQQANAQFMDPNIDNRRNTQIERVRKRDSFEVRSSPYNPSRTKGHTWHKDSSHENMDMLQMTMGQLEPRQDHSQPPTPESLHSGTAQEDFDRGVHTFSQGQGTALSKHASAESMNHRSPYIHTGPVKAEATAVTPPSAAMGDKVEWMLGADTSDEEDKEEEYDDVTTTAAEAKRTAHILAEQKRRNNIRMGFEELQRTIPSLQAKAPNQKISKAMILQRSIEHVQMLEMQRQQLSEEATHLRNEISVLQLSMSQLQSLPPKGRQSDTEYRTADRLFHDYMQTNGTDLKFLVFHLMFESLLQSFNQTVVVDRPETMGVSFTTWYINNCSGHKLRECAAIAMHKLAQRLFPQPVTPQGTLNGSGRVNYDAATAAALATFAQANQAGGRTGMLSSNEARTGMQSSPSPLSLQMPGTMAFNFNPQLPQHSQGNQLGMLSRSLSYPSLQPANIPK
eukprot:Ihof_evm19s6 gene=Ihof_evmTU19s6